MKRVILQRIMELSDINRQIKIEIDQPLWRQKDECSCEFRISSDNQSPVSEIVSGADEVQVVMIAFDAIRLQLKEHFPTATLHGLPIEIAFPRAIPYVAGVDTYREIEALAEKYIEEKYKLP